MGTEADRGARGRVRLHVHFAEAHMGPLPEPVLRAQRGHDDPAQKIIAMLAMLDARWLSGTESGVAKPWQEPLDETDQPERF